MEPLITVIVPVYNGEAYIEKCFDSILSQTYQHLEIIIINDGSTDRSSIICDEYAEQDERIIVVHQENVGLPTVRNRGLAMASGELIGFVDCDDSIHPRMYEILQKQLYDTNADVAMCEVVEVYDADISKHIKESNQTIATQRIQTFNQQEAFENLFNEKNLITVVPWNKLYKKEVFKNIRYPDGKRADDEFVIHHIIQAIQKIVFMDAILYYYYRHAKSITNEIYNLNKLDGIEAIKDRLLLFELQKHKDLLQRGVNMYLHLIIIHYFKVKKILPTETEVIKELKEKYKREFNYYKGYMTFKHKLELRLFFIRPTLYHRFIKIRERLSHLLFFRKTLVKS